MESMQEWVALPLDRTGFPPTYTEVEGRHTWCECGKHLWQTVCPERLKQQDEIHRNLLKTEGQRPRTLKQRLASAVRQGAATIRHECRELVDELSVRVVTWVSRRRGRRQVTLS
jgi:hypothetical protein